MRSGGGRTQPSRWESWPAQPPNPGATDWLADSGRCGERGRAVSDGAVPARTGPAWPGRSARPVCRQHPRECHRDCSSARIRDGLRRRLVIRADSIWNRVRPGGRAGRTDRLHGRRRGQGRHSPGKWTDRLEGFIRKNGFITVFALAAIPNPLFDIGGMLAGITRMPVWQFILATVIGKSVRFTLLGMGCAGLFSTLPP
ncbi:MAG: VTT domain-containing protein [Anaerolineae bacterium]|nr:VTT domain-containing protein [Anaerolineae bacterium]